MKKTPNTQRLIPFAEMEAGMMAGLWWVPEDGFVWDEHLRPMQDASLPDAGPWLRVKRLGKEGFIRRYAVLRRSRLLTDFLRVAEEPSMERIVRFADRWGWLGRGTIVVPKSGSGVVQDAESLNLWWDELLKFRSLYETWKAIHVIDLGDAHTATQLRAARRLLSERIVWGSNGVGVNYQVDIEFADGAFETPHGCMPGRQTREAIAVAGVRDGEALLARWDIGNILEPARYYVYKKVNDRLKGNVNLAVLPLLGNRMRLFPNDLLSAMYMHFAFELAGARPQERECESCHQPFAVRRRDQRFCDKNCRERAGYHRRKGRKVGVIGADAA